MLLYYFNVSDVILLCDCFDFFKHQGFGAPLMKPAAAGHHSPNPQTHTEKQHDVIM